MTRSQELRQIKKAIVALCIGVSAFQKHLTEEAYEEMHQDLNKKEYKECIDALDNILTDMGFPEEEL